jgi:predicted GTPase
MGGTSERVVYKTDNSEIERMESIMREQEEKYKAMHKEMFDFYRQQSEMRERENKNLLNHFITIQEKNEKRREELLLLLKESDEKHQKEIMELMKQNQENFVKLFNSQNSQELEKYKKICEDNEQKMQILEKQLIKTKEENDRKYKEQELKFQEDLLNAKDEIERKEIEKKQEEAKQKKINEDKAFDEFQRAKEEFIQNEYERIMGNFNKNQLNFCKKEIESFDQRKIEELIEKIFMSEEIDKIVLENLKIHLKKIVSESNSIVEHLNILLLGPSGVGKSTLINTIFKEEKCPTGKGKPCTKGEPIYYFSDKNEEGQKYIRLADSRGIEKSEYGVSQVVNSAKGFIEYYLKQKNPDEFVHLIWYCITGTRFENVEQESLKELCKLYTDDNLPIIVVYTQTTNEEQMEAIKDIVENMKIQVLFQDILAKEIKGKRINIQPYGVDKLIEKSIIKAKNAINSSCNTALRTNCIDTITTLIFEKSDNIQKAIEEKIENKIKEVEIGTDVGKLSDIIGENIVFIFLEYLNIQKNGLNNKTTQIIAEFVKNYFEDTLKLYQNNLSKIVKNESEKIAYSILDLQTQINQNNNGNLNVSQQMNKEAILESEYFRLFNTMKDLSECFCIKNATRYIWKPINAKLQEKLCIKYQYFINNNEELKKQIDEYSEKTFKDIGNNLNKK